MKAKHKRIYMYFVTVMLALLIMASAVLSYAYFSKKDIYDGYLSGEIELLFDRLDDTGLASYGAAEGITADKEQTWGTKNNPYVISNVRHLYNLSELQNIGYFDKQFISKNYDENGNLVADPTNIPYFIICEPDYTPVLIDGSSFKEITSIGNDEHPFIGSVKGVHIKTKDENGETINKEQMVTVETNTSATSVIHNVKVKSNPSNVDSGLFGYVSFIGDLPEESAENQTFIGTPSVISNIVLSDVQVEVNSSFWDAVTEFVKDIALGEGGHRFSFTDLFNAKDANGNALDIYNSVPHENHHIGILAGHVSYSTVEYISVYYSNDNVVAIDLTDTTEVTAEDSEGNEIKTKANYLSATGIIGFIYNLNPTVNEDGSMTAGSGDSFSDLSYSMVGGGGEAVGDKAGYILAKNIFDKYTHIANGETLTENSSETIKISTATTANGIPLCYPSVRDMGILGEQVGYYFYDGVFTFALSSQNDVIESTWEDEIDQFSIGSTSRSDWVIDYTSGHRAITAYISAITNDDQLVAAEEAGKPIIILHENDDVNTFLMSLFNPSTPLSDDFDAFSSIYTTKGAPLKYGSAEDIDALIHSYNDGQSEEFLATFEAYGNGVDNTEAAEYVISNLENKTEGWRVINLLGLEDTETLSKLRSQYKIIPKTESYLCYDENGNQVYHNDNFTISENYTYDLDGFFYFTTYSNMFGSTKYKYYWVGKDGSTDEWGTGTLTAIFRGEDAPSSFFGNNNTTTNGWHGENVYTKDGYRGILLNADNAPNYTFYQTNNIAIRDGVNLTKPVGEFKFFYRPAGEGELYYYINSDDSLTAFTRAELQDTGRTTPISGLKIYSTGSGTEGVIIDRYNYFSFSSPNEQNSMRLVYANYYEVYSGSTIWNGSDSQASTAATFKIGMFSPNDFRTSKQALVLFNQDGSCNIRYQNEREYLYVSYNQSLGDNGGAFQGSTTITENTKLRIYVLEATQEMDWGVSTFDPKKDTGFTFNANEHVLYATTNGDITSYEVMDITKLPNLGNAEAFGWKSGNAADGENGILSGKDLLKKFRTENGIDFGVVLNAFGNQYGTDGIITAPVGNLGTYADIPQSCVAFRVNKEGTQHIRVIISVSVSEYYAGQVDEGMNQLNILGNSKRFFNLWQINESGSQTLDWFSKNGAIQRFEIPISHPYERGTKPTDTTSEQGFYTNITYQGQQYGMYMNGSRVLVAYEFTVDEVGLYILGPSGFSLNDDGSMNTSIFDTSAPDVPMEIVYFSADGVASAGRDGASASQIGSIDYVYDFGGEIITVTDTSENGEGDKENYSTYYPSYCLTYFENTKVLVDEQFVSINNEQVKIRRYVADQTPPTSSQGFAQMTYLTSIKYTLGGDKYANIVQYSRFCDNVETNKNEETAE